MLRAICFDFDGTLAHFTGDFFADLREGAVELGLPDSLHESFMTTYLKFDKICSTFPEAIKTTLTTFNKGLPEDFADFCQRRIQKYTSQIELLPKAIELLEYLTAKNIPLAIITNGPKDIQTAAIRHVNIQGYFNTILISGELGIRKPDSRIFRTACERLEVLPADCLMVGDKLDADIEGAQSIGMQTAWITKENHEGVLSFGDLRGFETWLQTKL